MPALLFLLRICNIVEKILLSIVSLLIIGVVSISIINDDINDDRKLIRRKLWSILLCNQTHKNSFVKKNSKFKFSRVNSSKSKIISSLYGRHINLQY